RTETGTWALELKAIQQHHGRCGCRGRTGERGIHDHVDHRRALFAGIVYGGHLDCVVAWLRRERDAQQYFIPSRVRPDDEALALRASDISSDGYHFTRAHTVFRRSLCEHTARTSGEQ